MTSLAARLQRLPFPPLRDVVAKRPSTGANIDALDGVRGLAVLLVIASHTHAFRMHGHGNAGVWLFFSLSAFLLTLPFAARPERSLDAASLRHYVRRRLGRILPAYYTVLLLSLAADQFTWEDAWRHAVFVRADGIFWTLPQEMLFYLLLPLLAALHPLVFRRSLPATIVALLAGACLAERFLTPEVFALNGNGRWLRFHLGVFATGMAFAYAYRWPALSRLAARPGVNRALGLLGIALLLALVFSSDGWLELLPFDIAPRFDLRWRPAYALICGALIYATLAAEGRLIRRFFSSLVLRAMGTVSFGLYLFHVIVLNASHGRGVPYGGALFAVTLLLTYAIAALVYTFVERPFMRVGAKGGA